MKKGYSPRRAIPVILLALALTGACSTPKKESPVLAPSGRGEEGSAGFPPQEKEISSVEDLAGPEERDDAQIIKDALEEYQTALGYWEKADVDNSLKYLDSAYGLILQLNDLEDADLVQEKDELRLLIAKRINEIYTAHLLAVGENHDTIPLEENQYVSREISSFQERERQYFLDSYRRSGRYRPMILKIFREKGIPEELSWIPVVESGFKVRAYSRAQALGLWQFISSTGYRFGLKRSRWIDERMDPRKATLAAAEYLKELHSFFGDWVTVLAAYNCGEFRVQRLIRSQRINYLDNFWDLYTMLPGETRRFAPRVIATILIVKNPERYGFTDLPIPDQPVEYEIVSVDKPVNLTVLSRNLGLEENALAELNPELKYKSTPTDPYHLRVPRGLGAATLEKLVTLQEWIPPRSRYVIHTVRRGETVSHIARRYRTSVNAILRMNGLSSRSIIRPRQRLKIPSRGGTVPATRGGSYTGFTYEVKRGDSLSKIAYITGLSVNRIKALNNLTSNTISVGQVLNLRPDKPEDAEVHVVQAGDTPYSIARRYQMSLDELLRINGLNRYSKIYPGQRIWIRR